MLLSNELMAAFDKARDGAGACQIVKALRADGYDFIGDTANHIFTDCLARDGEGFIITISSDTESARAFFRLHASQPDNPLLPRVLEIEEAENFTILAMERLVAPDHHALEWEDESFIKQNAPQYISYLRGELCADEMARMEQENPMLRQTVVDFLSVSRNVYLETNGATLPYCSDSLDTVFLRKEDGIRQIVFADDPMPPARGTDGRKLSFMNGVYEKFGLDMLPEIRRPSITASPSLA